MTFGELFFLLFMALAIWLTMDGMRTRELGIVAARRACEREGLQFLDETVARAKIRFSRNSLGQLQFRRVYSFEYSVSGYERYPGTLAMVGHEVELIDLSAHYRAEASAYSK